MKQREKNRLRRLLVKHLNTLPEGKMIRIDNDALQELLFDEVVLSKKHNIIVKLPVWSGTFLRKLDLSKVDFSQVSWEILGTGRFEEFEISNITKKKISELARKHPEVNYSYTNANIDLSKSFETRVGYYIGIYECDLYGTNLNFDITNNTQIIVNNSDLGYTHLVVPSNVELLANNSNLSGTNLSLHTIDGYKNCMKRSWKNLHNCNLQNTGIKIEIPITSFKSKKSKKRLHEGISEKWLGCEIQEFSEIIEEKEVEKGLKLI